MGYFMAKKNLPNVAVALRADGVWFLSLNRDKSKTDFKACNSTQDWIVAIKDLFGKNGVHAKDRVCAILDVSLTSSIQLPQNEALTDEELHGIAMYKDLEGAVAGKITDYTWDYYQAFTGKTSRPMLNFVLVEKRLIALIADVINSIAILDSISISTLAMADFISYYQYESVKKKDSTIPLKYVEQLALLLYLEKGRDLTVYGVYNGELCYTRVMRNYRGLDGNVLMGSEAGLLEQLDMDLLRLCDDFFTARLGLPPVTRMVILMDTDQVESIAQALSENRRYVEVVPSSRHLFKNAKPSFSVCDNKPVCELCDVGVQYLPLYGALKGGSLKSAQE
jgi:hypothetical protein